MRSKLIWFNVGLRGIMETGIVAAFGYWGYYYGSSTAMKLILCAGVPLIGFGFWGAVDFRKAGRISEPLRLIQELFISGLAAFALYSAGQHALGWTLGITSVVHHALVYLLGQTLLKN